MKKAGPSGSAFLEVREGKSPKRENGQGSHTARALARDAPHGEPVVAIVVVLGVQIAIRIEVQVVRVVRRVHH